MCTRCTRRRTGRMGDCRPWLSGTRPDVRAGRRGQGHHHRHRRWVRTRRRAGRRTFAMILGRVVGELWAARRHPGLSGRKLLLIEPHYWYCPPFEVAHLVAVDTLGAGPGDDVIVCLGEPARQSLCEQPAGRGTVPGYASAAMLPVEAAVMAIVDRVDIDKQPAPFTGRPLRTVLPSTFAESIETGRTPTDLELSR